MIVFEVIADGNPTPLEYKNEKLSRCSEIGERVIMLLGGGTKKTQQRDIDQARTLLPEFRAWFHPINKCEKERSSLTSSTPIQPS